MRSTSQQSLEAEKMTAPPGLRLHYGPDYYAAFIIDPDGYKLEAKHQ